MNADELKIFLGKKIYLITKDGLTFTGVIEELRGETLHFRDKFQQLVLLDVSNVARIALFEINGGGSRG